MESRESEKLQEERQEQKRHRQVQEGRVEPSHEEKEPREPRAVLDLQEREDGQDEDGGDPNRKRRGGGEALR